MTVYAHVAVLVVVFQHLVPLRGVVLSPVVDNVYAPALEPCNVTVAVAPDDPKVNVAGVLVSAGAAGVLRILPVNVPVLTKLAAGHGTVAEVHANTVIGVGQRLLVPG